MSVTNAAILKAVWDGSDVKRGTAQSAKDIKSLGTQAATTLQEAWTKVGGIKGVLGIGAAVEAFVVLRQGITDLVKDTAAEERGMARLRVTLNNIGKGDELNNVASLFGQLQKETSFADDAIAQAFQTLIQGTGDYAVSRKYLNTVLDASIALDRDVASSAQLVAMVLEGNNRAVGLAVPQMRSFAATLDDIADPAERARRMMERLQEIVAGQAEADTKTLAGATARLKHNWDELMQTLLVNSGVLDATAKGVGKVTDAVIKLQETAAGNDPRTWGSYKYTHQLIPMKPPSLGNAQYDTPIGPMTKEEYDKWYNSLRFGPITESAFGEILPGPNNRQRGGRRDELKQLLQEIGDGKEAIDQYDKAWEKMRTDAGEAQDAALKALAATWSNFFEGAFNAMRGGWKNAVDYMRQYIEQALIKAVAQQLGQMFARSAISRLFGFAATGGGMMDAPIGGGGGPMVTQARGAAITVLQWRAARL